MSKTVKNTKAQENVNVKEEGTMAKTTKTKANTKAKAQDTKAVTKAQAVTKAKVNKINGIAEKDFKGWVLVTYSKMAKELYVTGAAKDFKEELTKRRAAGETFVISPSVNRLESYLADGTIKGMEEVKQRLAVKLKGTAWTVDSFIKELVNVAGKAVTGQVITYKVTQVEEKETKVEETAA